MIGELMRDLAWLLACVNACQYQNVGLQASTLT